MATRARSALENRGTDGSLAVLAGGATFGLALRTVRRSRARAAVLALTAIGLVGLGVRQRRWARGADRVETGADARRDEAGTKRVSDEAHAEADGDLGAGRAADETASVSQSETEPNPRGMTDRSDVDSASDGDPRFVEGSEDGADRETHLEDEDAHDPRLHPEGDDEPTEIDLSAAAMADEASEAAGPHSEQAYPTQEGTDPEPSAENAPERTGEGAVAPADSDDEDETEGDRDSESEGDCDVE